MKNHKIKRSFATDYYMYGIHSVLAALSNPKRQCENILCTQEIFNSWQKIINKHPFEIVTKKIIDKLLGTGHNHQGIVVKTSSIFSTDIKDLDIHNPNFKIAILDQITDPHNIGAIIRSAVAFGVTAILLPQNNSPNESALIAKAACGALEVIKVIKIVNLRATIEYLKKNGFWVIGLDANSEQVRSDIKDLFTGKIAIILGSEDKGVRKLTKEHCDFLIKIPITHHVESLNVSSAAAIIFYLLFSNIDARKN